MVRHNNQLADNLPQLQNLIKRDPESYHEEFARQKCRFDTVLQHFRESPDEHNRTLDELTTFVAQVAQKYPQDLALLPQQLIDVLQNHGTVLHPDMRMTFCKALIMLRNQNLLAPTDLLELFFRLLRCNDKNLRTFLETHIVTDVKNVNAKHKNARLNTTLQNFMFTMLKNSDTKAAKMSVNIMIELYKKNVWNDAKTVNVIATGCFSKITKVMVASLKFFLGTDPEEKNADSDSEEEVNIKEVAMANKVNKKSRKREKQLSKVKKLAVKQQKKKSQAPVFNFSALQLIHDPQGMAEKLFQQLESSNRRFEVKLLILDVISRLIGLHDLFLFSFYPYIQRFMQPHQREVTRILQFAAQASHELVPPDVIEPMLKTLANNFITERNSSDVMAVGLNAVREICARCPLAIDEDLLRDLAQYKTYRERPVMMAARALIQLFRHTRPELLHKKDRGRPSEATAEIEPKAYGQVNAKDYIAGAEVLLKPEQEEIEVDSEASDDDEWIDIKHSSDEAEGNTSGDSDEGSDDDDDEENPDEETAGGNSNEEEPAEGTKDAAEGNTKEPKPDRKILKAKKRQDIKELAQKVTLDRILTDEDFKRINMANIKKQVTSAKKGTKRSIEEKKIEQPSGLVKLADIENIYKKRKHDKQTRIESVKRGQDDREKFGYQDNRMNIHCSKTNREKRKKKNFQMIKHKVKRKVKKSFKEKQIALRNHLIKLKKMK